MSYNYIDTPDAESPTQNAIEQVVEDVVLAVKEQLRREIPDREGLAAWSREQLRSLDSGNGRRHIRYCALLTSMASNPQGSLPAQCHSAAEIKGAYRALWYPKVNASDLMASHCAATIAHLEAQAPCGGVLLAVQDTTTLNFTTHQALSGQGPIGKNSKQTATGFHAHGTLLLGGDGYVFGMLESEFYARDAAAMEARRHAPPGKRNREKAEDKESARWLRSLRRTAALAATRAPDTLTINVADREADMYELWLLADELRVTTPQLHLLVRSQHNRKLHGQDAFLHDHLATLPTQARWEIELPAAKGLSSQIRKVECVWEYVTLEVPAHQRKYQKYTQCQKLWAIEVREPNPPPGAEALHWIILSTWPITDEKSARQALGWYVQRWTIEVLHRTWKSGCKVEERRVQDPEVMQRLMMLDLMVAVQLLSLVKAARLTPDAPASRLLTIAQGECLAAYSANTAPAQKLPAAKKATPIARIASPEVVATHSSDIRQGECVTNHARLMPDEDISPGEALLPVMSIGEAVEKIARLCGYRSNVKKRPPGAELLWRGIQRLNDLTAGWLLAKSQKSG